MISVCNLEKRYGDFCAVTDVSFEVQKGEIVGLLGQNGAGKTTIMKMITGYLQPTKGKVTVGGFDGVADRQKAQQLIGYLPENAPLYPEMLVQEYLWMMAELRGIAPEKIHGAVSRAVLACGLSEKLVQPIGTLSKGYRQRVGLAQAILHRPSVLILDEPTNGLDPVQILEIRALIRELAKTTTIILSTHILSEIEAVCDRVIILINGHCAKDEKLDALLSSTNLRVSLATEEDFLEKLKAIEGVEAVRREQGSYVVETAEQSALSMRILKQAAEQGWPLQECAFEKPSLEQVFRDLMAEHAKRMSENEEASK